MDKSTSLRFSFLVAVSLVASSLFVPAHVEAQTEQTESQNPWESFDEVRLTISAGLIQPLVLRGGNVEVDVFYRRFVLGYSHGFLLKLEGSTVVGEASEQRLEFHLPYSTG